MNARASVLLCLTALLGAVLVACASTTPTVLLGPHPSDAEGHVRVAYPPPPARIEVIPLRRRDTCLWLDGYWDAQGSAWYWVKGAWVQAAPRCYYARPSTRFESTPAGTTLVYQPGAWYLKKGEGERCEPPPLCASTSDEPESSEAESP